MVLRPRFTLGEQAYARRTVCNALPRILAFCSPSVAYLSYVLRAGRTGKGAISPLPPNHKPRAPPHPAHHKPPPGGGQTGSSVALIFDIPSSSPRDPAGRSRRGVTL